MTLQPSTCLTIMAPHQIVDFFYYVLKSYLKTMWWFYGLSVWPFPLSSCAGCCATSSAHRLASDAEHHSWMRAFLAYMIYLQADKMQALRLNINVITLTAINRLFFGSADLPQLSMALIFPSHILQCSKNQRAFISLSKYSLVSSSLQCYHFVLGLIPVFCKNQRLANCLGDCF